MSCPKHSPDLAWRALGEFTAIIQLGSDRLFHELDEVGSAVWSRCDGSRTEEEIIASVGEEFDVDPATIGADVRSFLKELSGLGLLTWS
jgi:pyrroloquinoline quinone biosynthesis protein D